jgi:hypothetical protein
LPKYAKPKLKLAKRKLPAYPLADT